MIWIFSGRESGIRWNQCPNLPSETSAYICAARTGQRRVARKTQGMLCKAFSHWTSQPLLPPRPCYTKHRGRLVKNSSRTLKRARSLPEAAAHGLTLAAYDRRTIPPLLNPLAEEERT